MEAKIATESDAWDMDISTAFYLSCRVKGLRSDVEDEDE